MQYIDGAWAEILGWSVVLLGLAAFAGIVALLERGRRGGSHAAAMPSRLESRREWDLVMRRATGDLARSPRVESLQADAAVTLDAAEYALGRLLQDHARLIAVTPTAEPPALATVAPLPEPISEPAPESRRDVVPASADEPAPLAA